MPRVVNTHRNASDTCDGLQWERVAGVEGLVSPELPEERAAAYLTLDYFRPYAAPAPAQPEEPPTAEELVVVVGEDDAEAETPPPRSESVQAQPEEPPTAEVPPVEIPESAAPAAHAPPPVEAPTATPPAPAPGRGSRKNR